MPCAGSGEAQRALKVNRNSQLKEVRKWKTDFNSVTFFSMAGFGSSTYIVLENKTQCFFF